MTRLGLLLTVALFASANVTQQVAGSSSDESGIDRKIESLGRYIGELGEQRLGD